MDFSFRNEFFLCYVDSDSEIPLAQVYKAVDLNYTSEEELLLPLSQRIKQEKGGSSVPKRSQRLKGKETVSSGT